jgi:Synergist-CTERM protein sorting domain-containing protein
MAFAWGDLHGWWFLEGSGYAERGNQSTDLDVWGDLYVQTRRQNGARYVTEYEIRVVLDAPRFNINAWDYSVGTILRYPIKIPDVPPTQNRPFRLPPITSDGLTYDVEFTSATSGTIWVYGYASSGVVVDSLSVLWVDEKYSFWDKGGGCNTGIGAFGMVLPLVFLLRKKSRKNEKN